MSTIFPRKVSYRLSDQLLIFALGPLVSLLYLCVLTPTSYYALSKLRSGRWLTRDVVEVMVEPAPTVPN